MHDIGHDAATACSLRATNVIFPLECNKLLRSLFIFKRGGESVSFRVLSSQGGGCLEQLAKFVEEDQPAISILRAESAPQNA